MCFMNKHDFTPKQNSKKTPTKPKNMVKVKTGKTGALRYQVKRYFKFSSGKKQNKQTKKQIDVEYL